MQLIESHVLYRERAKGEVRFHVGDTKSGFLVELVGTVGLARRGLTCVALLWAFCGEGTQGLPDTT